MAAKKALHSGRLLGSSRPAIDVVLSFATLKLVTARQAEDQLRAAAALLGWFENDRPNGFVVHTTLSISGNEVTLPLDIENEEGLAEYSGFQATLKRWLKSFIRWQKLRSTDKTKILKEISPWTLRRAVTFYTRVENDRLVRSAVYNEPSVKDVIGEAIYLLLESGTVDQRCIACCPQCAEYFLKDRSDQKVCSNRCRQRQFRRSNGA